MATQNAQSNLAVQLQSELTDSSDPNGVLCRFIRKVIKKREQSGLEEEEKNRLCTIATQKFMDTKSADVQVKCIHLITATRSQAGIDQIEQQAPERAHGGWVEQIIKEGVAELYE